MNLDSDDEQNQRLAKIHRKQQEQAGNNNRGF